MIGQLAPALRMLVVMTVLTGVLYVLAVTGLAQALFPTQANGSMVERGESVVGSELLGQQFTAREFFHPRPSAAGYDGAASTGSNLGPTNPDLLADIASRATAYRRLNEMPDGSPIPVDAVTASASGLDPHISVANARLQAPRVAAARGLPVDTVLRLVAEHTDAALLGFLDEPAVNVLMLNMALEAR